VDGGGAKRVCCVAQGRNSRLEVRGMASLLVKNLGSTYYAKTGKAYLVEETITKGKITGEL